ncbi:hypothetical protein ACIQOV_17025 [Kitasatospora sp. NPDC091257]
MNDVRAQLAGDPSEHGQTLTKLAEAVGVLVTGQAEHSRILRAQGQALEDQTRMLQTLVSGQAALLEELRGQGGK